MEPEPEPNSSNNNEGYLVEFNVSDNNKIQIKCAQGYQIAGFTLEFNENHGLFNLYDGINISFVDGLTGVTILGQTQVNNLGWTINFLGTKLQAYTNQANYIGSNNWEDLVIFPNNVTFKDDLQVSYFNGNDTILRKFDMDIWIKHWSFTIY